MKAPPAGPPGRDELVAAQRAAFAVRWGTAPRITASAPGRINVIGEHTDYNGGLALPGAIDRWIVVTLSPRSDDVVRVHSEAFEKTVEVRLAAARLDGGWERVPLGAAVLFGEAIGTRHGFDALIGGNVPLGAGVSSSAAVEMALLNALRAASSAEIDDLELVRTGQRIEHDYLGVQTGLMDQYTVQFARAGALMLIDFDAVTRIGELRASASHRVGVHPSHEHVPVCLDDWSWLLLDSGVRHELADSAYGQRVQEARAALDIVARARPAVRGFRDVREIDLNAVDQAVPRRRLRHYVRENERVRAAARAVAAGDTVAVGALMLASHASLRDDYEVSRAELDALVDAAASAEGCAGCRMMGGGFGGCTINLVRTEAIDDLVARVSAGFERRFGYPPGTAVYRLVDGAAVHP